MPSTVSRYLVSSKELHSCVKGKLWKLGKHDHLSFISLGLNFEHHLFSFSLFGFLLVYYQSIFISKLFIEIFKSTEKHYEAGGKMTTVNNWVYFFVIYSLV